MDRQEEEKRERLMLLNPQRCVICDGQDGYLERESDSVFVHPYCRRRCTEAPEPVKT